MLDMRDNMITADALRFDGANADLRWNTFAPRGMGAGAISGPSDADPTPSFASPYAEERRADLHTSPANALTSGQFRPKTPELILKSFGVRPTPATHVRFRVVSNQCTGNPLYAGEQDNDPRSTTDCSASTVSAARQVVAAEFQVFSS